MPDPPAPATPQTTGWSIYEDEPRINGGTAIVDRGVERIGARLWTRRARM